MRRKIGDSAKKVKTPGSSLNEENYGESSCSENESERRIIPSKEGEDSLTRNSKRVYKTKYRAALILKRNRELKVQQYNSAKKDYLKGKFKTLRKCANFYKLPYSTLYRLILEDGNYSGSGKMSNVLLPEEEKLLVGHVQIIF